MRTTPLKVVFLTFFLVSFVNAQDLGPYKEACSNAGFVAGTKEHGECVLSLYEKQKKIQQPAGNIELSREMELQKKAEDDLEVLRKKAASGVIIADPAALPPSASPQAHECLNKYGFQPNTPEYSNCLMQLTERDRQLNDMFWANMLGGATAIYKSMQPRPAVLPRTYNCVPAPGTTYQSVGGVRQYQCQ